LLAQPIDLNQYDLVDLTHAYDDDTIYWPTSPTRFELDELARGTTEGGWFYSAYAFSMPEHGGTHLDAPYHFSEAGDTVDEVPLTQLIGAMVVIDVTDQAAADRDYRLSLQDVAEFEAEYGQIPGGAIVLLRTDWSRLWPNVLAYLGDDTPGDASKLSFPSFGLEAVEFLIVERSVAAIGVDTASIDYGRSQDFPVHRIVAGSNVPGLENLVHLDRLPPTGASIIALPIKIAGGSGGPVRVVAVLPKPIDRN
ncbi:MAG: cyclase family protein, partial [Proteobacteria bacterium]|nr:cyclase family protein [Pseudomonadota bacterium]